MDYVNVLRNLNFDFKLNVLTDRVMVNNAPLTDILENVLFSKLIDAGYNNLSFARIAINAYASAHSYHPIKDYLNSLKYDGGQHIKALAGYFDNSDGMFETWLRRWLIGAVRRVFHSGAQNRMMALDGPQGIGKSLFVKWLCPHQLQENHFKAGAIDPHEKDHRLALIERFIWEAAELDTITRMADIKHLKYFITLESVTERVPYARYAITKPALTSFIGTVNKTAGLLTDPTGNRRFMFCRIEAIDWEGYTKNINIDSIWAEAVMLYLAGESADLTPDEAKKAEELNDDHMVEEPIEGALLDYFIIDPKINNWIPTSEIIKVLEDPGRGAFKGPTNVTSKSLANVMIALGCERKRDRDYVTYDLKGNQVAHNYNNPIWGYSGIQLKKP